MSIESAAAVYDVLCKELSPKACKSLERIKAACDMIVAARGVMNYSSVARVTTENFGGPKKQSIQNNKNLKRYIATRMSEYMQTRKSHQLPSINKDGTTNKKYPVDNLDPRTKVYIDQLHSRLELAEVRYRDLRKWQETFTRANPINLAEAIGRGPTESGAMHLEYKQDDTELLHDLRQGIRELLKLTEFIALEIETRGEKKGLILKRPAGDHVVLNPQQFAAIEIFLEDTRDT